MSMIDTSAEGRLIDKKLADLALLTEARYHEAEYKRMLEVAEGSAGTGEDDVTDQKKEEYKDA